MMLGTYPKEIRIMILREPSKEGSTSYHRICSCYDYGSRYRRRACHYTTRIIELTFLKVNNTMVRD